MPVPGFLKHFQLPSSEQRSNTYISPFTLFIVTVLMFGIYIWSSTEGYFNPSSSGNAENPQDLIDLYKSQLPFLTAAVVYLYIMAGFSVRDLAWGISWQATLSGLVIFAGLALLGDLTSLLVSGDAEPTVLDNVHEAAATGWSLQRWLATLGHSFFNGIYEEIYFLGIVLAVKRQWLWLAIPFSLIVRFSFHTYQGLDNAFIIMMMGVSMLLLYSWVGRLWPFMVAHMVADVFGLGLIYYLP